MESLLAVTASPDHSRPFGGSIHKNHLHPKPQRILLSPVDGCPSRIHRHTGLALVNPQLVIRVTTELVK